MFGAKTIGIEAGDLGQRTPVVRGKAGGSDHRRDTGTLAGPKVRERAFGTGEVEQHVGPGNGERNVGADDDPGAAPEALSGVATEHRACGNVERGDERDVRFAPGRLRAAPGPCDRRRRRSPP